MDLSQNGLDFIKRRESLRLKAYQDIAGIWTIGYGTIRVKGHAIYAGMTCTEPQAEEWLRDECQEFVDTINRALSGIMLTQNQFDSLVSLTYNIGSGGFLTSTLLKVLRAGGQVVQDHFTRWSKVRDPRTGQLVVSRGLYNRRLMEWQMYSLGVYPA